MIFFSRQTRWWYLGMLIWRKAWIGGVRQSIRRLVAIWISLLLREGFEGGKHITLHYKATGRQHEGAA